MRKVLVLFFALGFFSLLSQTLIIREFIISFGGNELGIGLFYFFWLFWVGVGAFLMLTFLGKFLHRHFLKIVSLYPLLSFLEIILFITLRGAARVSWWEFFTLERVFFYLFLYTSLISFFTGIIFTLGVLWIKKIDRERIESNIIASSYIFESLGSFIAGCLVTFLIIKLLPPSLILLLSSIFFSFIIILVSVLFKDRVSLLLNSVIFVILLFFIFNPYKHINFFHNLRMRNVLPTARFINETYTPYQHIILGKLPSQMVVISNGKIISSIPEVVDADRESALFISEANFPKNILIFGYGVENLIVSLLKFPIGSITYCIEDKVYYDVVHKNLPQKLQQQLKDRRLKIVFKSPRLFLRERLLSGNYDSSPNKQSKEKFDLAIIYTSDPSNLVINTFFTKEFYSLLKSNLKEKGVLVTRITSAENFIGEEIRNYGSSLYYTLKDVFTKIVIVPGDINWFFAGGEESSLTDDPLVLEGRLKNKLSQSSFPAEAFRSIFIKNRVEFVKNIYTEAPLFKNIKLINRDAQPLTFFLNLLVMARYSNSYLIKFFKGAFLVGIYIFLIPILLFFIARINFLLKIENIRERRLLFNSKLFQFISGFLGFSFHLLLMFLFQNKFGTIFQLIGLLNALFMLGLCLGGFLGNMLIRKFFSLKIIVGILSVQAVVISASYPLFVVNDVGIRSELFLFIIFFLISGILTGSSYPVAAKVLQGSQVSLKHTAAYLEFLDHWGGSLGGLIGGFFMLPLLGIRGSLFILVSICFIMAAIFIIELVPLPLIQKERKPYNLTFPYIRTSYVLIVVSLSLIINSLLLERRRSSLEERPLFVLKVVKEGCRLQKSPFIAYVCDTDNGKEFILESKDFAPHIRGFSGPINLLIKIDSKGKIKEVRVIKHTESPSYVRGIENFLTQFIGHSLSEKFSLSSVKGKLPLVSSEGKRKKYDGKKEIDAMSGATVTSQAIVDIVNKVGSQLQDFLGEKVSTRYQPIKEKRKISFDTASLVIVIFVILAVFSYSYYYKPFLPFNKEVLRKIYLMATVIFFGFYFNLTFSFFHLANILTFKLPPLVFFSQFLIHFIPLVLAVFLGNIWCGWLCPFGALQEIVGSSPLHLKVSYNLDKKARYFKYLFLAVFIMVISVKGNANLFKQEPLSIFFLGPINISWDKTLSIVAILFSIFFLRFWCRYFCVCGAFLSFFNKIAVFKKRFVKKYEDCPFGVRSFYDMDCINCNLCLKSEKR
jgi:spermidine synthase